MKSIIEYQYSAVIFLIPSRYSSILRVEINPKEFKKENYKELFDSLLFKFRSKGFSVSEDKSFVNTTEYKNIMEFSLEFYTNEVELAKDITEELNKAFEFVLNRVIIKKELKKL